MIPVECLPLELPEVDKYEPTETGEPPLGRAKMWAWNEKERKVVDKSLVDNVNVFPLELYTMPGFAGSSAYYLRYMDAFIQFLRDIVILVDCVAVEHYVQFS